MSDRLSAEVLANLSAVRDGKPWPHPNVPVPLWTISIEGWGDTSRSTLTVPGAAVLAMADAGAAVVGGLPHLVALSDSSLEALKDLGRNVQPETFYMAPDWAVEPDQDAAGERPPMRLTQAGKAWLAERVARMSNMADARVNALNNRVREIFTAPITVEEGIERLARERDALRKRVADFERLLTEPKVEQAHLLALRDIVGGLARHEQGEVTVDAFQAESWRQELLEAVADTLPDVLDEALAANLHRRLDKGVAGALGLLEMQKDPETGESYLPSWHDMPERVAALVQEGEALREQVKALTDGRAALLAPVGDVDMEEVLRLDREVPPAPWDVVRKRQDSGFGLEFVDSYGVDTPAGTWGGWKYDPDESTAQAIATYRTAAPALAREVIRLRAALRLADEQSAEAIKRVSGEILADKWNSTAELQAEVERLRAAQRDAFKDGQIAALEKTTPIANDIAAQRDGSERRAQAMAARLAALEPVLSAAAQIMGVQSVTPTTPEEGGDYAAKLWDRINASVAAAEEARLTLLAEQGKPEGAPPGWSYKPGDPDFDEPGEWVHKKLRLKVWKSGTGWVWGRKERSGVFVGPSEQEDGQPARVVMLAATAAVK